MTKKESDALLELKAEISRKYELLWMRIFGSKARGDFDEESDIDIVLVLNEVDWSIEKDVYELCFYIGLKYDIFISPVIYSKGEIEDKLTKASPFFKTIENEGILI